MVTGCSSEDASPSDTDAADATDVEDPSSPGDDNVDPNPDPQAREFDIQLTSELNPRNQANDESDIEAIRPFLNLNLVFEGTIEAQAEQTWNDCRVLFLLGPTQVPAAGDTLTYGHILAVHPLSHVGGSHQELTLAGRVRAMFTDDVPTGEYNIWHKVECGVEETLHEPDYEEPDSEGEPETFSHEQAVMGETTVEVVEPEEAMIFENLDLSTEVLMVDMHRNDAIAEHPERPDERVYQPPHARNPIYDRPLLSVTTAVTQAGIRPVEDEHALPDDEHLDWNFSIFLEDEMRPNGADTPVRFQLSCKDRAASENGNRVDGMVLFPAVRFPHRGGTAHYHCDAQIEPLRNPPEGAPVDVLADFASRHPELFDINAQMDHENDRSRPGWWGVAVCMEHWRNVGTQENIQKEFLRKRCAKTRLLVGKSDDFTASEQPEDENDEVNAGDDNPSDEMFKSSSSLFGVIETFADPSSGDNQLKADFEAGIQGLDDTDDQGFRFGAGGEAYLDLLDGALEISLVEGGLWAGYDIESESGYYEASLSAFSIDVFDQSDSNEISLSIEETASYSYTYSLSYGIVGIITINFDMGFSASAGFRAGIELEAESNLDEDSDQCLTGEDEIAVVGQAGPVASCSASIGVSVTILLWQGGVAATLNIVEAYVGPKVDVGACIPKDDDGAIDGFYLFSGVWFGVEITVLSGDITAYVKWVWWCGGGTIWSGNLYEFDGITYTYDLLDEEFDLSGNSVCGNLLDVLGNDSRGYAAMSRTRCTSFSGGSGVYSNTSPTALMAVCDASSTCTGFNFVTDGAGEGTGRTYTACNAAQTSSRHVTFVKTDDCDASVFE